MDQETRVRALVNREPGYARMPAYIVHVLTGSKNTAHEFDLRANIYIQVFCTDFHQVYGPVLLDKSSNNVQPFRRGQIDEFHIDDLSPCGEIKKIRLWHDGGKATSWHCEW